MNKTGRVVLNCLWILLDIPGFLFGCLTGLGMFIAGRKVGVQRWKTAGVIYFVVLLILEIAAFATGEETTDRILTYYIVIYLIAVVHSIVILVQFIPRIKGQVERTGIASSTVKTQAQTGSNTAGNFTVSKDLYSVSNNVVPEKKGKIDFNNSYYESLNLTASAISTETPTKADIAKQRTEKIDINTCSEQELASLPGVSVVGAKKAIAYRDSNNGFTSDKEFYKAAGVQLHFVKQIKDKITCGDVYATDSQTAPKQLLDKEVSDTVSQTETVPDKEKKGRVLDI